MLLLPRILCIPDSRSGSSPPAASQAVSKSGNVALPQAHGGQAAIWCELRRASVPCRVAEFLLCDGVRLDVILTTKDRKDGMHQHPPLF